MQDQPAGRVGVLVASTTAPEEVPSLAKRVEDKGFGELWVAEDYFFQGGIATAGLALAATDAIPVGIGVLASVARHPAVSAMEIATLARAYPARVLPGIGHGVPAWTKQMGLEVRSPMSALRECMTGIGALLNGETVSDEGQVFSFRDVTLTHPVDQNVPLFTGVLGDKGLALTGEIADGLLVSALAPVEYVRAACEKTSAAADVAGRQAPSVRVLSVVSVTSDESQVEAVRQEVKQILAFYLAATGPGPLFGTIGINEQLADMLSRGGMELVFEEMPDSWLDALAIAGSVDTCRTRIKEFLDAGADSVVLAPMPTERAEETLTAVEELLPEFSC
ncbi:Flavin-dependent oxidoreductase, luciferase family (includes alkanesulfonate monooxygenase SsuD and methylene tetrahydromethanopterin reductase) [Haloechinothrix alba]|uniref:Flavin-dependent oxidoreductase, luciferase family (Includes alkanesulfonate monooxygenase SsuD and methylene tetrahydromethanopterin reductase) n=1 Tax=Haloechinothrix alba TaxID=664784 RepID=A0A239A1B8_9PSEU|nr:LLM class flavin-dependent oxidoreductase [Haloechinothrix alba]SNR88898.1 Flavin-dependent oxidoreductase, luciferase family (includes alkanesulfonate monooxygenase SsuD and methylene tetrahydromethanopterin reductase) [Haloechinothrix alba]